MNPGSRSRLRTLWLATLAASAAAVLASGCAHGTASSSTVPSRPGYPAEWFEPVSQEKKYSWEILPQEAAPGEVILSKRHELGIFSNFAATPFEYRGKRYASVEGFWQMMLYPESPRDPRARCRKARWPAHRRADVAQMVAFEAKKAGDEAFAAMKACGIDWVSFEGERFRYESQTPGRHHQLIIEAMRAKLEQNPKVRELLLQTAGLRLRPDHHQDPHSPPEWRYFEIWMQFREELLKNASKH